MVGHACAREVGGAQFTHLPLCSRAQQPRASRSAVAHIANTGKASQASGSAWRPGLLLPPMQCLALRDSFMQGAAAVKHVGTAAQQ